MTSSVQKSAQAFRTISEVAGELEVPQHVLRFWESKFSQVKPMKRGGGRRYYRPQDVDLLRGIRTLLYDDGFTIKGVQKVFRERGVRFVTETGALPNGQRPTLAKDSAETTPAKHVEDIEPKQSAGVSILGTSKQPNAKTDLTSEQRDRLRVVLSELLELKGLIQAARGAKTLMPSNLENDESEQRVAS